MNKKKLFSSFAVLLCVAAIMGTMAYFTKNFSSDNNVAKAAIFDVDAVNAQGKTIGNAQFNLGDKLYPGMDPLEVYSFQINKNNTEVPVAYKLDVNPSGDLFPQSGASPVKITMQRKVNNQWVNFDYTNSFKPDSGTESFKILVDWPHGNNDIDFQGKTGNVRLGVTATQVDKEQGPTGPPYFTKKIEFKATPNGSTRTTTNKEVNFYLDSKGEKVIEVKMGDGNGDFEKNVGNFTVTTEYTNGVKYYRVITDKEYYASKTQLWRINAERVDTSVKGTIKFPGVLADYLLIESDELYNWFIKN
ncbi:hypothetical protein [Bacillus sp. FJAT-49736]|uniref:hypothetical protein n=1 Tax=Bacillus sp. FJAT-49736 TaxID=2833582 RepID=UPI001BC9E1B3|nr:hypothetical protein [Bacillus sp. FJAT-49736]MBS4174341.1 hypothetical protein [Bacillus sp. FJAT-49736]